MLGGNLCILEAVRQMRYSEKIEDRITDTGQIVFWEWSLKSYCYSIS
jgi:hypothetical protein